MQPHAPILWKRLLIALLFVLPFHGVVQVISQESDQGQSKHERGYDDLISTEGETAVPELKPMHDISTDIWIANETTPPDVAKVFFDKKGVEYHLTGISRPWISTEYRWCAAALAHHPVYFEDINLERYGWSLGAIQPAVSTAHFFGRVIALPYMVAKDPPHSCVYNLGHGRPGSCVPYYVHHGPIDYRAALVEAGTVVGLILLIP